MIAMAHVHALVAVRLLITRTLVARRSPRPLPTPSAPPPRPILLATSQIRVRLPVPHPLLHACPQVVSSSLLLIYDDAEPPRAPPGVWMIDFANCLGHDVRLSHRAPWAQGNHEDGYLAGLDSLVDMFTSISRGGQAAHGDAHGRTDAD